MIAHAQFFNALDQMSIVPTTHIGQAGPFEVGFALLAEVALDIPASCAIHILICKPHFDLATWAKVEPTGRV